MKHQALLVMQLICCKNGSS